jgi:DNA-binding NarL/FixJ family response regulator
MRVSTNTALCLVMSAASDRREDILSALQAGVNGYIPKSIGIKQFSSALEQIVGGAVYVPASIASPSNADSAEEIAATAISDLVSTLTSRQKDVLTLLVKGDSNKEIAKKLGLGQGTVKVHLASLFRVLGVHTRSAAAVKGAIVLECARMLH